MLPLTVNDGGYLTVDTDEWLDDISEVSETWTNVFNAYCAMRAKTEWSFYVTDTVVRDWANSLGAATGIYGEDGPFSMSTINYDTFLENDISYVFVNLERNVRVIREDGEEEYETHHDALVIVNGYGYSYATPGNSEVRIFTGDDDADIVSHSSGYTVHSTREDCGSNGLSTVLLPFGRMVARVAIASALTIV